MSHVTLTEIAQLLAAMAIAPPLARRFGIGTVLGYLLAGVALGPHGIRHVFSSDDAHEILEFSEFGIVLLLFIIGLELRPKRLWAMRAAIFRLGGAQVILTALVLKGNPITTVKSPSETDQKLLWVIGPDPDDASRQIILITSRDAAAAKKYTLPPVFVAKEETKKKGK